jgi:Zn-dependent protease with chaperone function
MARRPGRTALALAVPVLLFVAFGMARVSAPFSALGLVFDQPAVFAIAAGALSLLGAVLLFLRPVELAVAPVMAGRSRPPDADEGARLGRLLGEVAGHVGIDPGRLIVRVIDDAGANASAGAAHLLFVTTGALRLGDEGLEAILAHELGHHRGLHPVLTAVVWWLSLPGVALAAIYRLLRRGVVALGSRLGVVGRVLAVPLLVMVWIWQLTVMWLFWLGELLALRAARVSEFEADAAAARWGYAAPLAASLERLSAAEIEPEGRLARLRADHPPTPARLERLREHTALPAARESSTGLNEPLTQTIVRSRERA